MNSQTTAELFERLSSGGTDPGLEVLEEVLALGDDAIEPLRDLLHRVPADQEEEGMLVITACLLGMLDAKSALPDIVALHRVVTFEAPDLSSVTAHFGPDAVDLLIPIINDRKTSLTGRSNAIDSAIWASEGDDEATKRLSGALRNGLQKLLDELEDASPDNQQTEFGTYFADGLIELGDVDSQSLIEEAWDRNLVDQRWLPREEIPQAMQQSRKPKPDFSWWLDDYRAEIEVREQFIEQQKQLDRELHQTTIWTADDGTYQRTRPKVGRNDPCWCGSGKKYKKCHLEIDQKPNVLL